MSDQGRLVAGVSAIIALVPFMYEDHSVLVYEKHLEYKSKIYGPLATMSPMFDSESKKFVPGAFLTWNF
jgi:hypothetical protein